MDNRCFACGKNEELTSEHIIPQAIGGRLKERLYCKECNNTFGHELDCEISRNFGYIGTLLNIKRERGQSQPYEVKELSSGTSLVFDGEHFKRKDPIVKIESGDGKKLDSADIRARSKEELKKIWASMEKRYEEVGELNIFQESHPGPTNTEHVTTIDDTLIRRAVSKIAYGFLCIKIQKYVIFSPAFDGIREYIRAGNGPKLSRANFIHTQFMVDRIRPLHKIHISLDKSQKLIIGYVSLFGIFRFTVLLSENFESQIEWPGLDYTYDPVQLREVVVNEFFRVPRITKEDILHPKQSKKFVENELSKGHKIIDKYTKECKFIDGEIC